MFEQVTIIGAGLIGSSIARAVSAHAPHIRLVVADQEEEVCKRVVQLGFAHEVTDKALKAVQGSDLVVLAVPPSALEKVANEIAPALKAKSIVTDVGSVKGSVVEKVSAILPESVDFVPGHPIAGTEHSGPDAGFKELFENRWCILTPAPDTAIKSVERVTQFWEEICKAKIEIMEPAHHDLVLAITSHLPHLIAYTIVGTADELEDDLKAEVIKFSASGFRGFTRIAASDPTMWRDVFINNREAVLEILQRFNEDLTAMQKAIRRGDGDFLFDTFERTRAIRKEVMEMGPEGYPNPDAMAKGDSGSASGE